VAFGMLDGIVCAFGQRDLDLMEEASLQAWGGDRSGDSGRTETRFYRGTNGLVAGQFERDFELLQRDARRLQGRFELGARPRARLAQHPFRFDKLSQLDAIGPGPWMVCANDDDELITCNFSGDEHRIINRALNKPEFGKSLMHGGRHLCGVADIESDIDRGIGAPEGDEVSGQPVAGDGLAGMDGERAALQTTQFGKYQLGCFGTGEHGARLIQEERARFGELDAASDAVEQLGAVSCFQGSDRGTDRRLCEMQRLGGARHVLTFGDRHENAKLLQRHAHHDIIRPA